MSTLIHIHTCTSHLFGEGGDGGWEEGGVAMEVQRNGTGPDW